MTRPDSTPGQLRARIAQLERALSFALGDSALFPGHRECAICRRQIDAGLWHQVHPIGARAHRACLESALRDDPIPPPVHLAGAKAAIPEPLDDAPEPDDLPAVCRARTCCASNTWQEHTSTCTRPGGPR